MGGGGNGSSNGSGDFNDPVTNGSSSDLLSNYLSDLKMQLLKVTEMVKDKCQHIKIGV